MTPTAETAHSSHDAAPRRERAARKRCGPDAAHRPSDSERRPGTPPRGVRQQSDDGVMGVRYPDLPLGDGVVGLRLWSLDDLRCVEEASTDPRIPPGTTVPAQWSVDAGREFIERQWSRVEQGQGVSLAVHAHEPNRAVGLISMMLRPQAGVIGLGYWIVPGARGRGYATRAATLASDWAIGEGGFARMEAWVEPDNVSSQRVLAAAGFALEGCLRSFLEVGGERSDALVYSRIHSQSVRSTGAG